ncbi:hypothetical protein Q3G72_006483 [Acer saccharum]|nr:hypothetical protein Q3G72_006483 [Acer saccharum]
MAKTRKNPELEKQVLLALHFLSGSHSGGRGVSCVTETIHPPNVDERDSFSPLGTTPRTTPVNRIDPQSDLPLYAPNLDDRDSFPPLVTTPGTVPVNQIDPPSDLPFQFGSIPPHVVGTLNFPGRPTRSAEVARPSGTTPVNQVDQISYLPFQFGSIPPHAVGIVNFPGRPAGSAEAAGPSGTVPVNQVDQTSDQSAQVERQNPGPFPSLTSRYRNQSRIFNNIEAVGPGLEDLTPYQGEMEDMSNTDKE